jgi:hypothetical protein
VLRRVAPLCAGALLLSACAQSGYSASKLQRELQRAGLTAAQATCVTTELENSIDPNKLGSYSDPNPTEVNEARAALKKCDVKQTLLR